MSWTKIDGPGNWLRMPVWSPSDGPAKDIFMHHVDGSRCAWSCAWLMPDGRVKLPGPMAEKADVTSLWWEGVDNMGRHGGDRSVGQGPRLSAIFAGAPSAELLEGKGYMRALQDIVNDVRANLYPQGPFFHPTCVQRTGNPVQPL